jgi:hypothetical protein
VNVSERIRVEQHEVGALAALDRAFLRERASIVGGVPRRRLQGLHRRQSGANEQRHLLMQADAW